MHLLPVVFSGISDCVYETTPLFHLSYPDRESPCHVKLLRSQKVVYISCGEEHTAVLTKVEELTWKPRLLSCLPDGFTLVS